MAQLTRLLAGEIIDLIDVADHFENMIKKITNPAMIACIKSALDQRSHELEISAFMKRFQCVSHYTSQDIDSGTISRELASGQIIYFYDQGHSDEIYYVIKNGNHFDIGRLIENDYMLLYITPQISFSRIGYRYIYDNRFYNREFTSLEYFRAKNVRVSN